MTKETLASVTNEIVEEQNELEKLLPLPGRKRGRPKRAPTAPIDLESYREEIEKFLQRRVQKG